MTKKDCTEVINTKNIYLLHQLKILFIGIVNVPVDFVKMFKQIPIKPEDSGVIQLKLMRHMDHKTHYLYETIRPHKVYEAAMYLKDTPLYQKYKIEIDETWPKDDTEMEFKVDKNEDTGNNIIQNKSTNPKLNNTLISFTEVIKKPQHNLNKAEKKLEEEEEEEEAKNHPYQETLMDNEMNEVIQFAPGNI